MIRSPSHASLDLRKYLFGLLGLSLTSLACGGKVVVDRENGNAGGGGTGGEGSTGTAPPVTTSTSSSVTTGTGGGGGGGFMESCSPAPLAVDEYDTSLGSPELLYICIEPSSGECPPKDSSYVRTAIEPLVYVYGNECSVGVGRQLHDVPCGPDPSSAMCCYAVRTVPW